MFDCLSSSSGISFNQIGFDDDDDVNFEMNQLSFRAVRVQSYQFAVFLFCFV